LAVFASAANRAEHRTRGIHQSGITSFVEGAVALLFEEEGELGSVASDEVVGGPFTHPSSPRYAPVLEPGLSILLALARRLDQARFEIREPQRTTAFRWSRP
jgi:hypothetical protein